MKIKKLMNVVFGVALATAPMLCVADDPKAAPKPNDAKPQAQAPAPKPVDPAVVDKMLAFIPEVVAEADNGVKISAKEVKDIVKPQIINAMRNGETIPPEEIQNFSNNVANSLLTQLLISKEADGKGFKKDAAKGKEHLEKLKAQFGPEKFKKMIEDMKYTEEFLVDKFAEQFQIDAFIESIAKCDEAEAKKFYESNPKLFNYMEAAHILAMFPGAQENRKPTEEEKKKTLEKLKEAQNQLAAGKDFAEVAKAVSDCPSKEQGGNLGRFGEGDMVPEFEAALKKLKPGEISKPVETKFGYHIIKAGDSGTIQFDEVKERIIAQMTEEKKQKSFNETVEKLMKAHKGKVNIPQAQPKQEAAKEEKAPEKK